MFGSKSTQEKKEEKSMFDGGKKKVIIQVKDGGEVYLAKLQT